MTTSRAVRNVAFCVLLVVSTVVLQQRVLAAECADAWAGYWINLSYCGPYSNFDEAVGDMEGIAQNYCVAPVYYYTSVRVGDFQGAEYYDSTWYCSWVQTP